MVGQQSVMVSQRPLTDRSVLTDRLTDRLTDWL